MLRTRIQLTEEQTRALQDLVRERHVSEAELVRQAVDLFLSREALGRRSEEQRQSALDVAGRFRSGTRDTADTARHHDEALAKAFATTGERSGARGGETG